ncbi:AmmeMemoRadiSam system radical SAM enzyme [Extibacter muris]|uniref:AmmeMemoRadiSam system radical SAM enzyme n=1 Tax=Extibacter muris TaxID=1796622 RepID=UPI001D0826AC|nr:AmmeMemoRadiSam system radical SAM enzyme [Extibacter muris]MCB6203185.1 AmmeMemoRadiSam system radical SAM enzyme [Extibacter muris]MCQ4664206.1 AmmeMemoRadiSam system radical SAM enzyme [Extibacter muris]MCQ4694005.1 AmmeMemoRadiSam system radical SAM enzyme [Extibacter muris]
MKKECRVCMHRCALEEGQTGRCRARANKGGEIVCANYGQVTALALDPVEKKPLRRFCPGTKILSVGSFGCNLNCPFCQNHDISMADAGTKRKVYITPEELAGRAQELETEGNIGIAYTYNEPLVGYEYIRDTAALVRKAGLKNVVVTNGSVKEEVLMEVLPFVDAMNIDLKGFTEGYYRMLGGDLETVKRFIRHAVRRCHVELTTLIVPGQNDSAGDMGRLAQWVAGIDRKIPLHVTRFFPAFRMSDGSPTNVHAVYRLAEEASKYLDYVYTGNC